MLFLMDFGDFVPHLAHLWDIDFGRLFGSPMGKDMFPVSRELTKMHQLLAPTAHPIKQKQMGASGGEAGQESVLTVQVLVELISVHSSELLLSHLNHSQCQRVCS